MKKEKQEVPKKEIASKGLGKQEAKTTIPPKRKKASDDEEEIDVDSGSEKQKKNEEDNKESTGKNSKKNTRSSPRKKSAAENKKNEGQQGASSSSSSSSLSSSRICAVCKNVTGKYYCFCFFFVLIQYFFIATPSDKIKPQTKCKKSKCGKAMHYNCAKKDSKYLCPECSESEGNVFS